MKFQSRRQLGPQSSESWTGAGGLASGWSTPMVGEWILARGTRPQSLAGDLSIALIIWQLTHLQSQSSDRRQGGSHRVVWDPVSAATISRW